MRDTFFLIVFSYLLATNCREGDYYNITMIPTEPLAPSINVGELIKQSGEECGWDSSGGVLNSGQASQVLCGLSQQVEK